MSVNALQMSRHERATFKRWATNSIWLVTKFNHNLQQQVFAFTIATSSKHQVSATFLPNYFSLLQLFVSAVSPTERADINRIFLLFIWKSFFVASRFCSTSYRLLFFARVWTSLTLTLGSLVRGEMGMMLCLSSVCGSESFS